MALTSQGTRSSRSRPDQYRFAGPGWIKDLAAGRIAMSWLNAREGMTVNSEKVQADAHELWQTGVVVRRRCGLADYSRVDAARACQRFRVFSLQPRGIAQVGILFNSAPLNVDTRPNSKPAHQRTHPNGACRTLNPGLNTKRGDASRLPMAETQGRSCSNCRRKLRQDRLRVRVSVSVVPTL